MAKRQPLPTDLQILNKIYDRYYPTFKNFSKGDGTRTTKNYVPIDIPAIASNLGVDSDIVFGRLYYHLEPKHGYRKKTPAGEDAVVYFYAKNDLPERDCVNFPILSSVLAALRAEDRKDRLSRRISYVSLGIALLSLGVAIITVALRAGAAQGGQ